MSKLHHLGWAAVLTALPVSLGIVVHHPVAPAADQTAGVDLDTVVISRSAFCDNLSSEEVATALADTDPATMVNWEPGQVPEIPDTNPDVVNEWGCQWVADDASASGWVFDPPMTRSRALEFADVPEGCREINLDFGSPSRAYSCGGRSQAAGLFGDAWLTCSVTGAGSRTRLADWCRAVARAAGT